VAAQVAEPVDIQHQRLLVLELLVKDQQEAQVLLALATVRAEVAVLQWWDLLEVLRLAMAETVAQVLEVQYQDHCSIMPGAVVVRHRVQVEQLLALEVLVLEEMAENILVQLRLPPLEQPIEAVVVAVAATNLLLFQYQAATVVLEL
jgi:hypothetical protein